MSDLQHVQVAVADSAIGAPASDLPTLCAWPALDMPFGGNAGASLTLMPVLPWDVFDRRPWLHHVVKMAMIIIAIINLVDVKFDIIGVTFLGLAVFFTALYFLHLLDRRICWQLMTTSFTYVFILAQLAAYYACFVIQSFHNRSTMDPNTSYSTSVVKATILHTLWCYILFLALSVDAFPRCTSKSSSAILLGLALTCCNSVYLLAKYRFILSRATIQPLQIALWGFSSDTNSIAQSCLINIFLFVLRLAWNEIWCDATFVSVSGGVNLVPTFSSLVIKEQEILSRRATRIEALRSLLSKPEEEFSSINNADETTVFNQNQAAAFHCLPTFDLDFPSTTFCATPLLNITVLNRFWKLLRFRIVVALAVAGALTWSLVMGSTLASRVCFMLYSILTVVVIASRIDRNLLWLLATTANRFEYLYLCFCAIFSFIFTFIETQLNVPQLQSYATSSNINLAVQVRHFVSISHWHRYLVTGNSFFHHNRRIQPT
jgi:hypothetical protein